MLKHAKNVTLEIRNRFIFGCSYNKQLKIKHVFSAIILLFKLKMLKY